MLMSRAVFSWSVIGLMARAVFCWRGEYCVPNFAAVVALVAGGGEP